MDIGRHASTTGGGLCLEVNVVTADIVTNADHQVFGVITIGGGGVKGISGNLLGNRGAIIFRGNQGVLVTEAGTLSRSSTSLGLGRSRLIKSEEAHHGV